MSINSDQVTGFVVGIGAAALGLYMYKRNQTQIEDWLRQQGIALPQSGKTNDRDMAMEDLVREKERLEDLIAEREMKSKEQPGSSPA